MRVRSLLIITAIASSVLGAVIVYLVLTVPNDLHADAMLKQARQSIARGDNVRGRDALTRIVQQYPRTDAAAAATVALVKIADEERQQLEHNLQKLQQESTDQKTKVDALSQQVTDIANAPPKTITVEAPAKKTSTKKTSTKKKQTTSHHRRRRR